MPCPQAVPSATAGPRPAPRTLPLARAEAASGPDAAAAPGTAGSCPRHGAEIPVRPPGPPQTLGAGESRVSVFPPSPQPVAASGACCGPGLRRPHQNTGVCEDFLNYFEKPVSSFFLFLFFLPLAVARDHVRWRAGPGRRPCWALQEITPNPPRDNAQSALTLQSPARPASSHSAG